MTPKEQYEARKAERKKQAESWKNSYEDREKRERLTQDAILDTLDRFVTAVERIADAMERPQLLPPVSNLTFDPKSSSGFKVANTTAV